MDNHYHLLLRIQDANLSEDIRWVQVAYGSGGWIQVLFLAGVAGETPRRGEWRSGSTRKPRFGRDGRTTPGSGW
jgi:hypothetical protein